MRTPTKRQLAYDAISCAYMTDGMNGSTVTTTDATQKPRRDAGASSAVPASAVSSLIPAPTPDTVMPAAENRVSALALRVGAWARQSVSAYR